MPDPLSPFDIGGMVASGGAFGGFVDFCRQLTAEGSLKEKTFHIKYDKTKLGLSSAIVYVFTSLIIGVGGAFGVQFVLIMLKSFSPNSEPTNDLLLFSISIVAGIGARSLIPRISDHMQEQLFKVQKEVQNVAIVAKDAATLAEGVRAESTEFSTIMLTLRPDAPKEEVDAAIHRLEIMLRENENRSATVHERTETIWLGRLYKKQGKYGDAIKWLDRYLRRKDEQNERDKDYADVLYNKACYLSLAGDHEAALNALKLSVSLSPINKEDARGDKDFSALADDPYMGPIFKEMVKA